MGNRESRKGEGRRGGRKGDILFSRPEEVAR